MNDFCVDILLGCYILIERDAPQSFVRKAPSSQDSSPFFCVVDIHFLLIKYCNIFSSANWLVLNKFSCMRSIMWTSFASSRKLNESCFISSTAAIVPAAYWNILSDLRLVAMIGSESSLYFPHSDTSGRLQLDDAPASSMAVFTFLLWTFHFIFASFFCVAFHGCYFPSQFWGLLPP